MTGYRVYLHADRRGVDHGTVAADTFATVDEAVAAATVRTGRDRRLIASLIGGLRRRVYIAAARGHQAVIVDRGDR